MDVRSMACFIAVAEELHFRRAAEKLNLTQPSLSQRIRVLESEIGATLLLRDRRSVALTPAGAAFLEPARRAVENANRAIGEARRTLDGEAGPLRLGFTVIAFYGILPACVQVFRKRYPNVRIELAEMNSPSLENALLAGALDLGILHPPLEHPELSMQPLPEERLFLAMPSDHPLAAEPVVPVSKLGGEPFLIAPRKIGASIFDRVIALFESQGVTPRIVQEVTPMTTLAALVAAGVGLGFVTEGLSRLDRPGVVFRPVEPAAPALPVAAAWVGPDLMPSAKRFLDVVLGAGRSG